MIKKMNKTGLMILVFLFLGILALGVGSTSLVKRSKYLPVEAQITKIEEEYDAAEDEFRHTTYAKFRVDGKDYEENISYYQDGFKEGDIIEIRYDPEDPAKIEAAPAGVLIYFTVIGAVLIIAAIFLLLRGKR